MMPGAISVISLISVLSFLAVFHSKVNAGIPSSLNLAGTVISSLNVSVLFAFLAFRFIPGMVFALIAVFTVLWIGVVTEFRVYYLFIVTFFLSASTGWAILKIKGKIDQTAILKLEKLEEEINLLSDEIGRKKNYIKSLEEKLNGYSTLKEVVGSLSTALSLSDVSGLIIKHALKMIKKDGRALLFLVDVDRQELWLSASRGGSDESPTVKAKKGDPFDHWVLKHRKPLIIEDLTKDFRFPNECVEMSKDLLRSLIAAPLMSENRMTGLIRIDSPEESRYTQDDLRVLDIIADLAAVAVQNSILYSKTQELAIRDGLTGLFLHRYFMERLEEEIRRAGRSKAELSLLILDVDHFKNYNDRYGHMAGDLVLKYCAEKLKPTARHGDIIARYGGDEMAIVIFGADKATALKEALAIKKRLEEDPFTLRKEKLGVTLSIGIASYPQDGILEDELLRKADERLYKAKSQGRNRICSESE